MDSTLTFPRQYASSRRFTLGAPRTLSLQNDGIRAFFLRSQGPTDPVLCLWNLDVVRGTETLLVDPRLLDQPGPGEVPTAELARRERARESSSGIVSYTFNQDASIITFAYEGSLYVMSVGAESGKARRIGTEPGVFDPRPNPSGSHIAYVCDRTLRCVRLGSETNDDKSPEQDKLLAGENDPLVSWGRADFIAGEEMGRTRGFWWSPDGDQLLVTRVDDNPVERRWISDPATPENEPTEIRYPVAGSTNASVGLALVDLEGRTRTINWSEGEYEYLSNVIWTTGHAPLVVRQTRDQKTLSIAELDVDSLELNDLRLIEDEHWVELVPGSPTRYTQGLLTIEDKAETDSRSLCLDGNPLTPPGVQVRSLVGVSDGEVIVTASTDPTEIHVLAISLPGNSKLSDRPSADLLRWLTSDAGVHGATLGGPMLATMSSSMDHVGTRISVDEWLPKATEPEPEPESETETETETDLTAASAPRQRSLPLAILSRGEEPVLKAEPTFLELGPRKLNSALFLPTGLDMGSQAAASLPVLLDPYGGPHAQRVLKANNSHLASQWFADQGFAVLVVDGRGTPGRGPGFERSVWGDLAGPVLEDQLDALDAVADLFPILDLGRVGIRGWSFGGYLAALAAIRSPERIHAAIAGAPVTTWRLYDTHYTERYLGHPIQFPEHYDQTDLIMEAESLGSPLLLIHGLADDNVVAAHTLRMSSALLNAGRSHQVLPLSGVTHMTPQESVTENLLWLQRDFLKTHLGDVSHND